LSYEQKYYDLIVPIAKKLGITWGGDWTGFPDKPHFEKLKFDSGGTIIEDDMIITDQTKIPQIDNKEVQAIKSELLAKDTEITSLKLTVTGLDNKITELQTKLDSIDSTSTQPLTAQDYILTGLRMLFKKVK
jgi:hypothetical protein